MIIAQSRKEEEERRKTTENGKLPSDAYRGSQSTKRYRQKQPTVT